MRIWALLGARPGDNDQVIALAETIGHPFEVKQLRYNGLQTLGPRVLGHSLVSLAPSSRDVISGPPPDLTISTGHRSVPVVQALRHRSGGNLRSIHIGFPRISPRGFDLVITTPQYPIADHRNVLGIPIAITRAANDLRQGVTSSEFPDLARPRRLLVVGGPTLYWTLDGPALLATLQHLLEDGRSNGGSILVTTSARTPPAIASALAATLSRSDVSTTFAAPTDRASYMALLEAADTIHVTADSVSMISDAVWTGKPMALVPIRKSQAGNVIFALNDLVRRGARVYPQDLRAFWRSLEEFGVGEKLASPRGTPRSILEQVRSRALSIIHAP